jgi:hypothetical protein
MKNYLWLLAVLIIACGDKDEERPPDVVLPISWCESSPFWVNSWFKTETRGNVSAESLVVDGVDFYGRSIWSCYEINNYTKFKFVWYRTRIGRLTIIKHLEYYHAVRDPISTVDTSELIVLYWSRNQLVQKDSVLFDGPINEFSIYYPILKPLAEKYWDK